MVGLYTGGGLIFGGGAYIWNEVSVSTCGGLIHGGGLYSGGGAYSRRFTVFWFPRKDFQFWLAERNSRIGKNIDQYLVNIYLTSKLSLWFP